MRREVDKVVVAQFLEAVREVLQHLSKWKISLNEQGKEAPAGLSGLYGRVRRLRDYLQRCVAAYPSPVQLDAGDEDEDLMAACAVHQIGVLDLELQGEGNQTPQQRAWLDEMRRNLAEWAVRLAHKPIDRVPSPDAVRLETPTARGVMTAVMRSVGATSASWGQAADGADQGDVPLQPPSHDAPPPQSAGHTPQAADQASGWGGDGGGSWSGAPAAQGDAPVEPNGSKAGQGAWPSRPAQPGPRGASGQAWGPPPEQAKTPGWSDAPQPSGEWPAQPPESGGWNQASGADGWGAPPASQQAHPHPQAHPQQPHAQQHPHPQQPHPQQQHQHQHAHPQQAAQGGGWGPPPNAQQAGGGHFGAVPGGHESLPIIEPRMMLDPRLRTMMGLDVRAYERARQAQDFRLAMVHLASIVEGAILDFALPRRAELGIQGPPEAWKLDEVLARVIGDRLGEMDRAYLYQVISARNLIRPSLQIQTPMVVTADSLGQASDFVRRLLAHLGFAYVPGAEGGPMNGNAVATQAPVGFPSSPPQGWGGPDSGWQSR